MPVREIKTPLFGPEGKIKRPKPVIVLDALIAGQTIEFDGNKWGMSEDFVMGIIPLAGMQEGQMLGVDMSIGQFCKMAEQLSDKYVLKLTMDKVLTQYKRES